MSYVFSIPLKDKLIPITKQLICAVDSIKNTVLVDMTDVQINEQAVVIATPLRITNFPVLSTERKCFEEKGKYYVSVGFTGDGNLLFFEPSTSIPVRARLLKDNSVAFDLHATLDDAKERAEFVEHHEIANFIINVQNLVNDFTTYNDGGGNHGPGLLKRALAELTTRRAKLKELQKKLAASGLQFDDKSKICELSS